jgi:cobalamin biosynthesis protein CobT
MGITDYLSSLYDDFTSSWTQEVSAEAPQDDTEDSEATGDGEDESSAEKEEGGEEQAAEEEEGEAEAEDEEEEEEEEEVEDIKPKLEEGEFHIPPTLLLLRVYGCCVLDLVVDCSALRKMQQMDEDRGRSPYERNTQKLTISVFRMRPLRPVRRLQAPFRRVR